MKKFRYIVSCAVLMALLVACDQYPVQSVSLDASELILDVGETHQIEAVILPLSSATNNTISWSSSDESVATVSTKGIVTAVYTGTCVITAKAGKKSASCTIIVNQLDYEFSFKTATALYYADDYEVGSDNYALRLLGDGISMTDEGALSGEGIFVNIDLNAPLGSLTIPAGTYELSSSRDEYTFAAGEIYEESGTQYATGTFVGQRTADGLTVIFVKSGSFWITEEAGAYNLSAHLIGEHNEDILITFGGTIKVIDKTGTTPPMTYTFVTEQVQEKYLGDVGGNGLSQFQFTAADADTTLQFVLYAPLSVTESAPYGTYGFDGARAYSIASATFNRGGESSNATSGEVSIALIDGKHCISCKFVDEDKRIIYGIFKK